MRKRVFVVDDQLCSGCRSCEVWCSLVQTGDQFRPSLARIKVFTDAEGRLNRPVVDCTASGCALNQRGEPICVEMCPTGTLILTDSADLQAKRAELERCRRVQPIFKLIVPWKYPYPWRPMVEEGE